MMFSQDEDINIKLSKTSMKKAKLFAIHLDSKLSKSTTWIGFREIL